MPSKEEDDDDRGGAGLVVSVGVTGLLYLLFTNKCSMTLTPTQPVVGGVVRIDGKGWRPNEQIVLTLQAPGMPTQTDNPFLADSYGRWSVMQGPLPDLPPGTLLTITAKATSCTAVQELVYPV